MRNEIPEDMRLKPLSENYNPDLSKMIFHVCNWLNGNGDRFYSAKKGVCYPTDDITKAIRFAYTQLSAKDKDKETCGYLESEKQFQLIALRGLGIDYEKHGCTFEQSINGVFHMAVSARQELKEKDELLRDAKEIIETFMLYNGCTKSATDSFFSRYNSLTSPNTII